MIPEFPVVPGRDLNNGTVMPQFGLGTWLSPKGDVEAAVLTAIQLGYRHVDAAWVYGNEGEVGNAVAKSIKDGFVKREQLYLTTKLWNIFHDPKDVDRACDMSLKNLQTDYIGKQKFHKVSITSSRLLLDALPNALCRPRRRTSASRRIEASLRR